MSLPPANAADYKVKDTPSRVAEGWQRVFPVLLTRTDDGWEIEIWWWRLLLSLTVCLGFAWAAITGGAFLFVKYKRGFTEVRYTNALLWFLPSRWEAFQVAYGNFYLEQAKEEAKKGKGREAYFDLVIGMAKSPANKDGRLLLAEFYVETRRPDLAQSTLLKGLKFHKDDTVYLDKVFAFLLHQQSDDIVKAQADWLLPEKPAFTPRNQLIAMAKAEALFYRGNYDQAEDLIHSYQLDASRQGLLLIVRIEWERGEHATALAHLGELAAVPQLKKDAEIYSLTVTWLREIGREDDALHESRLRQLSDPGNPYPRIDLLKTLKAAGDTTGLHDAIESLLRDFADDDAALVVLADYAANAGDFPLAQRIYLHAKEDPTHRLNWEAPALMQVEAQIVAKNYQPALDLASQLLAANPDWNKNPRYLTVFDGLQAIAAFGLGDKAGGHIALTNFINHFVRQPNLRAENLLSVSRRLIEVGVRDEARRVLAQAVKTDPLSQPALTQLITLDLEFNNTDALATNIVSLTKMRKPDPRLLQAVLDKLSSDLFLFRDDRTALLAQVRAALSNASSRLPPKGA